MTSSLLELLIAAKNFNQKSVFSKKNSFVGNVESSWIGRFWVKMNGSG